MQSIMEHTMLITKILKNKLEPNLIKLYSIEDIEKCCDTIENYNNLASTLYEESIIIQEEMVKNNKFIDMLEKLKDKVFNIKNLEALIESMIENGENILNYSISDIVETITNE